jgi:hypothetical protein
MKTEQWIDVLARDVGPAPTAWPARRLSLAAFAGWVISATMAVGMVGMIPTSTFATPAPWIKLLYCGLLALGAGSLAARMGRPGASIQHVRAAVAAVPVGMLLIGAIGLWQTPAGMRAQALLGQSWWMCPWGVLALSLPGLVAAIWAVKALAPTRPARTGFVAGLFAGAVGACGYSLACPESSSAFVAVWYTLGILLTGLVGAVAGNRWFRW